MKFIEKNWFIVLAFLLAIGGLVWLLLPHKSTAIVAAVSTPVAITPVAITPVAAVTPVSAVVPGPTKSASIGIVPGKPIVLMFAWPSDPTSPKSLLIQCRESDITGFSVGDYVTLVGSKLYPGRYKIWYDYSGNNPAVGSVRNLYLETKFIINETGTTIAKA